MKRLTKFFILFVFMCCPRFVLAEPFYAAHTKVELVSDAKSVQPGSVVRVALKMTLDDGWHVYWKNPGDSGLAPVIAWDAPEGVVIGDIHWPMPGRIVADPLTSYGYEHEVYLISDVKVPHVWPDNKEMLIKAKVDWLACRVDCIPGRAQLQISFPVSGTPPQIDTEISSRLADTISRWPVVPKEGTFQAFDRGAHLELRISSMDLRPPFKEIYFYPERSDVIDHAMAQTIQGLPDGAALQIRKSNVFPAAGIPDFKGVLVYAHEMNDFKKQAVEVDVRVERVLSGRAADSGVTLWVACAFAFLGGIILNLMPCVLPVLSLKILGLIKHSKDRARLMRHSMAYCGGVIVSFWLLAAILIVLKAAGHQIGWGFQFQSSYFIVFMAALLCLLSLNMFGVFEVAPLTVSGTSEKNKGEGGSFLSGVLATAVATPCTAPFMGAALGYALSQPPSSAFLIFTCLGTGMAAPFVLLSAFPQLLKWIPKPGSWMVNLKIFLGFILMASVVWLVWILGIQKGVHHVGLLLYGLLFISIGSWLIGLIQNEQSSGFKNFILTVSIVCGVVLITASAAGPGFQTQSLPAGHDRGIVWKKYSPQLVEDLLNQKKAVVIDFTAAWCLTCQINDRLVFQNPQVRSVFAELSIEALKADWTNKDPAIARALQSYGKSSIPLYVYYPAGSIKPEIWPEIITPEMVIGKLRRRD